MQRTRGNQQVLPQYQQRIDRPSNRSRKRKKMGFLTNYFTADHLLPVEQGKNILIFKRFMWCFSLRFGTIFGSLLIFVWSAFRLWDNNEKKKLGYSNLVEDIQYRFLEVSEAERVAAILVKTYDIYHVVFIGNMISAPIQFIGGYWNIRWLLVFPIIWNVLYMFTQFAISVMKLKTYFDIVGVLLIILSTYTIGYIELVMIHQVIEDWLTEYINKKIKENREKMEAEKLKNEY